MLNHRELACIKVILAWTSREYTAKSTLHFISLLITFDQYEWHPVMTEKSASNTGLLRTQKVQLIDILSADADFVLQHADSRSLLSTHGYQQVKACRTPSEKVTDLLDHIIQRGPEAAQGFWELLSDEDLQKTFPRLAFVNEFQGEEKCRRAEETLRKRVIALPSSDLEEIPRKVTRSCGELQWILTYAHSDGQMGR